MLSKDELINLTKQERYKKRLQVLGSETLHLILNDPSKAREYAQKNIDKTIPDNQRDEYIEMMINGMQILAKAILEERGK